MKLSEEIGILIEGIDRSINGSAYRESFVRIKKKVERLEAQVDHYEGKNEHGDSDLKMSDLKEMAPDEHKCDWPLTIRLLAGRKRIMLGSAFSSYLSEGVMPVEDQEKLVKVFNEEYHRIKNKQPVSPEVANHIIEARDAYIREEYDEVWYRLYKIADPTCMKTDPWAELEELAKKAE